MKPSNLFLICTLLMSLVFVVQLLQGRYVLALAALMITGSFYCIRFVLKLEENLQ